MITRLSDNDTQFYIRAMPSARRYI